MAQIDPKSKPPRSRHQPMAAGASNLSQVKAIVTGNSGEVAEGIVKLATSENEKLPSDSTLPKWLDTNPEILAAQLQDLLALMQKAKWFVYGLPVTVERAELSAIRITLCPPPPHKIDIQGAVNQQYITLDGKPVINMKGE